MKEHPIYPNILVTESGEIYSTGKNYKTPRLLKLSVDERGYQRVRVQVGLYQQRKMSVHRLVAETYLDNPHGLSDVDHLDKNPSNNNLSNLEWTSHAENCRRSRDNIGRNKAKNWTVLNVTTGEEFEVYNLAKWCQLHDVNKSNLHKTLERGTAKGYKLLSGKDVT